MYEVSPRSSGCPWPGCYEPCGVLLPVPFNDPHRQAEAACPLGGLEMANSADRRSPPGEGADLGRDRGDVLAKSVVVPLGGSEGAGRRLPVETALRQHVLTV